MANRSIKTSLPHRGYALVKMAYPLFGLLFINIWSSDRWFGMDITWLGLPAILLVIAASHIFLLFLETDRACRLYSWIYKGAPPSVYLNWLTVSEDETDTVIRFGLKRLKLSCVDEVHLSIWGNLIFKSRILAGEGEPETVFKLPFGVISSTEQKQFVDVLRSVRPDVILGKRIEKKLSAKLVKGDDLIQALGAVFLMYVLFDLSHSLAGYLEMLKEFHQAQVVARQNWQSDAERKKNIELASAHFARAEAVLDDPVLISLVKRTILNRGFSTAAVYQARAEALWYLDKKDEAIESMRRALEFYPKSLHMHLELARWYALAGRQKEARKLLLDMADQHEDALLPRLYVMVLYDQSGKKEEMRRFYDIYCDKLDLEVFGEEPCWPPGGNRYLNDSWSRDDMRFLLDTLILKN